MRHCEEVAKVHIHEDQPTARPQEPHHLLYGLLRLLQMAEHEPAEYDVKRTFRQTRRIGRAYLMMNRAGCVLCRGGLGDFD
jgi:hypothetical protein